jgi:hypothetical protein
VTARTLVFYRARPAVDAAALFDALVEHFADARGSIVVDQVAPDQSPLGRAGMRVWDPAPWHVLVRCAEPGDLPTAGAPAERIGDMWTMPVEQFVAWDDHGSAEGVKFTSLVAKLPHIDDAFFRTRYAGHAAVAREHHGGCVRYVQSVVDPPAAGPTGDEVHAVSELTFASVDQLLERMYTHGDASIAAVRADTSQFIDFSRACSVLSDRSWTKGTTP